MAQQNCFCTPERRKVLAASHTEVLLESLKVELGRAGAKVTTATGCAICRLVGQP